MSSPVDTGSEKQAGSTQGSSSAAAEEELPRRAELPPLRFWLLAIGLSLGLFLSFIDTSIVATCLFSIGKEFNDIESVNYVALSYTLSYLGTATLFARVSDVVGRRNAFIAAFVLFFAFSIGCGFSQSMNQLIACRVAQGLGGAGLYSITMIIFPEVSPARFRPYIGSIVGIVIAVGGVLGPVLGGVLAQNATWRWVFWINGPIGAVSLLVFMFTWPKDEYLPDLEARTWGELDYVGSMLLIAGSVLVVYPFQNAGNTVGAWDDAIFLGPLLAGIACWIALISWVIYADRRWGDKLAVAFPMRLMRNRVYLTAVLNTILLGFGFLMLVYTFPLRLQVVNGKSPLMAGVMLLPLLGSSAIGSVVAGAINSKKDRLCETLVAASGLVTLGFGLLSTLSHSGNVEAKALGFLVFIGLGYGMSAAGCTMLANFQASIRDHAPAQGIVAQSRVLGGSIGIAASSAIFGVVFSTQLGGMVASSQLVALHGASEQRAAEIRHAYRDAFREYMLVAAVVAGISVLVSLGAWSRNRPSVQQLQERHTREESERRKPGLLQTSNDTNPQV